ALFHAANNNSDKDTLAPQTADKVTERLKAGHAQGNTMTGKTVSTPNAHVKGRSVNGVIARPAYNVQEEGTVVVTVWVDNYGNVKKAQAGAVGTTVNNAELWSAAREAALKTHFNMSTEAPPLQQGKITYQFKLTSH
ncbi:MAG: energy transducer TonB, partial [Bacteroidales bacterium]|nr:energy transducer TonB [Bacteroidales bacterium]